eukprot:SAG11_NODE_149_length_14661_cov_10.031658_12_plen_104_part_00
MTSVASPVRVRSCCLSMPETKMKLPAAVFYAFVRYHRRILDLSERQVEMVADNMRDADVHGVEYRVVKERFRNRQWYLAPSSPRMYSHIKDSVNERLCRTRFH